MFFFFSHGLPLSQMDFALSFFLGCPSLLPVFLIGLPSHNQSPPEPIPGHSALSFLFDSLILAPLKHSACTWRAQILLRCGVGLIVVGLFWSFRRSGLKSALAHPPFFFFLLQWDAMFHLFRDPDFLPATGRELTFSNDRPHSSSPIQTARFARMIAFNIIPLPLPPLFLMSVMHSFNHALFFRIGLNCGT